MDLAIAGQNGASHVVERPGRFDTDELQHGAARCYLAAVVTSLSKEGETCPMIL